MADCGGLLSRCPAFGGTLGSNPSLSVYLSEPLYLVTFEPPLQAVHHTGKNLADP